MSHPPGNYDDLPRATTRRPIKFFRAEHFVSEDIRRRFDGGDQFACHTVPVMTIVTGTVVSRQIELNVLSENCGGRNKNNWQTGIAGFTLRWRRSEKSRREDGRHR